MSVSMDAPHGAAQADGEAAEKHSLEINQEEQQDAKRQKMDVDGEDGGPNGETTTTDDKTETENPTRSEQNDVDMKDANGDASLVNGDVSQEPKSETKEEPMANGLAEPVSTPVPPASSQPSTQPAAQSGASEFAHLDQPEGQPMPKAQLKQALQIVKALKRLKDAGPFVAPVDPVKLNIPTYFDYIKQPMDLGTMERKATAEEYASVSSFVKDFNLIVDNCVLFNGADSPISAMAKSLQASFVKYMGNMPSWDAPDKKKKKVGVASGGIPAVPISPSHKSQRAAAHVASAAVAAEAAGHALGPTTTNGRRESTTDGRPKREIHPPKPKDLPYTEMRPRKKKFAAELRFCSQVLKELTSKKHQDISYPFLLPVDPVALGCPEYFDVIKEPMDLSTIQDKLTRNMYENADEFHADVKLMFNNCYRFNPANTPVNELGHRLERVFDKKWTEKPVPVQSPAAPHDSDASDYSDYDEEYASATSPTIELLEKQIAEMKRQLHQFKKIAVREAREERMKGGARRKPKSGEKRRTGGDKGASGGSGAGGSAGSGAGGRRASNSGFHRAQPHVTFDMKKELSEKIPVLDEDKLQQVIKIIQDSVPDLEANDEEIELDMDVLDNKTLQRLYDFVIKGKNKKERSGSVGGPKPPGKKSRGKPLSEAEQSRRIAEIKEKITEFSNEAGPRAGSTSSATALSQTAGAGAPASTNHSDSSSDDDDHNDEANNRAGGGALDSDESSSEEE